MQRRFDGLVFDVGDILYDASVWRKWLTRELQSRGVGVTYEQLVERWEELLRDVYKGQAEYWSRFARLLETFGISGDDAAEVERSAREKGRQVQQDRVPLEGVPLTLSELRHGGVRLGVLSDNEQGESGVRFVLAQLGIEDYFDAVVSSADIGAVKPEAVAFEHVLKGIGVAKDRAAFVGHDIDELEGAKEIGLFAIAYNYHPDAPADLRIGHFSELATVVFGAVSS